jgi:hypothetical protein
MAMNAREQYIEWLASHDWDYEHSDDQTAWRKGYQQRVQLMVLQPLLDPNYVVWNMYAPIEHRHTIK